MMTIKDFQTRCYRNAKKLGWTDKHISIPEMIALVHSEASEGLCQDESPRVGISGHEF